MSRQVFPVEQGLAIVDANTMVGIHILQGSGAPGGDTAYQDAAPIGSFYLDRTNAQTYQKFANAGASADWVITAKLSAGFDALTNGTPAAGDSLEEALGYIYANLADLQTAAGIAQGAVDFGTFTGGILSDNLTAKALFQELETYLENFIVQDFSVDGVEAETVIDSELVDNILAVEYLFVVSQADDETNRETIKILFAHDGTPSADAAIVDEVVGPKVKLGSAFNYTLSTSLNGVAGAQVMRVNVASTETNGVNVRARRVSIVRQ